MTNQSAAVLGINTYDDYGKPASTNLGRFQYTGQIWMAELELHDYKARMRHPDLPVFLQLDPIWPADGPNGYIYVGGDPINLTDPSGMQCTGDRTSGPNLCVGPEEEAILVTGQRPRTYVGMTPLFFGISGGVASASLGGGGGVSLQKEEPKRAHKPKYDARVNYCGGEGGARFPNDGINQACFNHDVCYDGSGIPRSTCDLRFAGEIYLRRLFLRPSPWAAADAAVWSLVYGTAVATRGWQYYVPKK